jgi:hypothetical protein
MLIRYAILGPVAFALVELPEAGSAGTSLETPCRQEHHGIVVRGDLRVVRGRSRQRYDAETAFHVPAGSPSHRLQAGPGSVVAGFMPIEPGADVSDEALASQGFVPVSKPRHVPHLPRAVRLRESDGWIRRKGQFEVEGSLMGSWLLMHSAFRPGDYSGGWCEVAHWGLVLDGAVAINYRSSVELLATGDVFFAEPGHQFETPDGATIVDYSPVDDLDGSRRIASWRRPAIAKSGLEVAPSGPESIGDGDVDAEAGAEPSPEAGERRKASGSTALARWSGSMAAVMLAGAR